MMRCVLWFLALCATAAAGTIIDQQNTAASNVVGVLNQNVQWREDFTSGLTGNLLGFDLFFSTLGPTIAQDVVVDVLIGGTSAATRTVHYNGGNETLYFDFSSAGISLTAGDGWTLQVAGTDTSLPNATTGLYPYQGLSLTQNDTFDGSLIAHYVSTNTDDWYGLYNLRFIEYVDTGAAVPEPATGALFLLSLAGLAALRRRA